jgi:hypothetical protein
MNIESGDWNEYKLLIIDGIRELKKDVRGIQGDVRAFKASVDQNLLDMSIQLAGIKTEVKTSARNWGLLAGVIPALLILALWKLLSG